jgi:hypothetical protein
MTDDPQDVAEALDDDKLGDEARFDEDPATYPPDRLLGADDYGVTDREAALEEPMHEREARFEPDPLVQELDRAADERARRATARPGDLEDPDLIEPSGRLVDDDGQDGEQLGLLEPADDLSSEEAAVHVEREAERGEVDATPHPVGERQAATNREEDPPA